MVKHGTIGTFFGLGLLAEVVVFAAVAGRLGVGSALLLTALASLLGVSMLRRSGASALAGLRTLNGGAPMREEALVDGLVGAVGALLLVVPGFLSDLVGLFLLAPSGRRWLMRHLGVAMPGQAARCLEGTIDLDAGDWTRIDTPRRP